MVLLSLLCGCPKPAPDPLAAQRAALIAAEAAELPPDWAPHATLVLGRTTVDTLIRSALNTELAAGAEPLVLGFLGTQITITQQTEIESLAVGASSGCTSCLTAELELRGSNGLELSNETGSNTSALEWTASVHAVFELSVTETQRGKRVIALRLADADSWTVDLHLGSLPPGWAAFLANAVQAGIQDTVAKPDLPPIPVARLEEDGPVSLKGLRVRTAPAEGIALDFAFGIATAGSVDSLPDPGDHWAVVAPSATLLGLMQAAALKQPTGDEKITPEIVALSLADDAFELTMRAWPKKGRAKPQELVVHGTLGLTEAGEFNIQATSAELVKGPGVLPNLAVLLFKNKIQDEVERSLSMTVPARVDEPGPGSRNIAVEVTGLEARGDTVKLLGTLTLSE